MGTDYGRGITNTDMNTGIRFGVIPSNKIHPDWIGEFIPPKIITCPSCGNEISEIPENLTCSFNTQGQLRAYTSRNWSYNA